METRSILMCRLSMGHGNVHPFSDVVGAFKHGLIIFHFIYGINHPNPIDELIFSEG